MGTHKHALTRLVGTVVPAHFMFTFTEGGTIW